MARIKEKQEVLVVGYPNRVKAVADVLDMEGTGIYPVQVGIMSGNQEFLARLKLHSHPAAVVILNGPFREALVPTVEQACQITPAPILAVLTEKRSSEDTLKKAGVAAVLQHDGNITADEVVGALMEMMKKNNRVSADPCPVLRVPNAVQKPVKVLALRVKWEPKPVKVLVPRMRKPTSEVAPTLRTVVIFSELQEPKPVIARMSRMKRPTPEAVAITSRTFVVPESWRASAALAVASRTMLSPSEERLVIDDGTFNRRRRVTFYGRRLYLSPQLCTLLKMLHDSKEQGIGMREFYKIAILTPRSAAVAVANLRRALVKVNRQWGEVLSCVEGRYFLDFDRLQ